MMMRFGSSRLPTLIGSNKVVIGTPVSMIRRDRAAKRGHLKAGTEILQRTPRFRRAGMRRRQRCYTGRLSVGQEQSMSWICLAWPAASA
jgi:hypothetical protein